MDLASRPDGPGFLKRPFKPQSYKASTCLLVTLCPRHRLGTQASTLGLHLPSRAKFPAGGLQTRAEVEGHPSLSQDDDLELAGRAADDYDNPGCATKAESVRLLSPLRA